MSGDHNMHQKPHAAEARWCGVGNETIKGKKQCMMYLCLSLAC